jgi:DNA-binding MarR family transcriptional regulator
VNVPIRTISPAPADSSSAHLAEEIIRLLLAVRRALRARYAREVGSHGLTDLNHYIPLLHQIAGVPGVTVNELARSTGFPKSRVSVLVAQLVDLGIVIREADEHDTRLVRLRLTSRAAEWRAASGQALLRSLQPLSDQQLALIVEGLGLLQRALEQQEPVEGSGPC